MKQIKVNPNNDPHQAASTSGANIIFKQSEIENKYNKSKDIKILKYEITLYVTTSDPLSMSVAHQPHSPIGEVIFYCKTQQVKQVKWIMGSKRGDNIYIEKFMWVKLSPKKPLIK